MRLANSLKVIVLGLVLASTAACEGVRELVQGLDEFEANEIMVVLEAKGISSVRSRVLNLNELQPEIDHQAVCTAMIAAYQDYYQVEVTPEYINPEHSADLPGFEEKFATQCSWDWNFGKTPPFTHAMDERFDWGGVELLLNVVNGTIENARLYTDMLDPLPLEKLADSLTETPYRAADISATIASLNSQLPHYQEQLQTVGNWLAREIS